MLLLIFRTKYLLGVIQIVFQKGLSHFEYKFLVGQTKDNNKIDTWLLVNPNYWGLELTNLQYCLYSLSYGRWLIRRLRKTRLMIVLDIWLLILDTSTKKFFSAVFSQAYLFQTFCYNFQIFYSKHTIPTIVNSLSEYVNS